MNRIIKITHAHNLHVKILFNRCQDLIGSWASTHSTFNLIGSCNKHLNIQSHKATKIHTLTPLTSSKRNGKKKNDKSELTRQLTWIMCCVYSPGLFLMFIILSSFFFFTAMKHFLWCDLFYFDFILVPWWNIFYLDIILLPW